MARTPADNTPLSTEARRGLRLLKQKLKADYTAFDVSFETLARLDDVGAFLHRSTVKGRLRALDRLKRKLKPARFEGVTIDGRPPVALWSILKPRSAVNADPEHPRDAQDCVTYNYCMIGSPLNPGKPIAEGCWSLEVTDHALGRMIERAPRADHAGLIREAHRRLKNSSAKALQAHSSAREQFLVPTSAGSCVCEMMTGTEISRPGQASILVKMRTFLSPDLDSDLPILRIGRGEDRAGLNVLIPMPLRTSEKIDDRTYELSGVIPREPELLGLVSGGDA
jgi:hypothetical protein